VGYGISFLEARNALERVERWVIAYGKSG
jgi:hypothetical protein